MSESSGSQLLSDIQTFFISKMNNNGATPIIEKTDTVPVGVVEDVLNNSVKGFKVGATLVWTCLEVTVTVIRYILIA